MTSIAFAKRQMFPMNVSLILCAVGRIHYDLTPPMINDLLLIPS
jgi:hypothetical protein